MYRLFSQHLPSLQFGPKANFRQQLYISGDDVPTVDVLIFYCNEALDVLLDTVRATCSVDYPESRLRVLVLDDSDSVSRPVQELTKEYSNLFYTTRGPTKGNWNKAGNINHGLGHVENLLGGASDYVAGLDIDMIPEKDWLRRVIPHLMLDPQMGLVNPHQRFYNLPRGDPLGQLSQYDQLNHVRQIRRDFGQVGLCGGTGWVARRSALDAIGGFAIDSSCEDYLTCIDLLSAGWKVAILNEDLQWGLVPDSLNGHIRQIERWTAGLFSFYRALSARGQHGAKIIAEVTTICYMTGVWLCYFILPLVVLSGRPVVHVANKSQLRTLLRLGLLDFIAQSMHGYLESWTADFNIYS